MKVFLNLWVATLLVTLFATGASAQVDNQIKGSLIRCDQNNAGFCTEINHKQLYNGKYSGHDEPSVIFYSDKPGAGNNATYHVTLPLDPPVAPRQDGTGGTFNFQLHPAFWFGMVLCDTQSSPNFSHVCVADTDANIFDNPDPSARDFIGLHPGAAFMELQFYPPAGLNTCSDPTLWCVAMTIDSFNVQDATNTLNNVDCQRQVGLEPVNFAFLTLDGGSQGAAGPLGTNANKFGVIPGRTMQMKPGDQLIVSLRDTPDGLQAVVQDLTSGVTGLMTASTKNGFAQINFDPDPAPSHPTKTCSSTPYAFHPMFATSSEHTRAVWTTHTYNVAFSDEIGHFELCNAVDFEGGNCTVPVADDQIVDDDDTGCFSGSFLGIFGLQPIGGCINGDFDFDSASYKNTWPGTGNTADDAQLKPTPIVFTSPVFQRAGNGDGSPQNYDRVAFEADMPAIEFESNPNCNILTGDGCTNPPAGAAFYPIFSVARHDGQCHWQLGGPHISGTTNNFGGTATAEYGAILAVNFIDVATPAHPNGTTIPIFSDYRQILPENPCKNNGDGQ